MNKWEFQFRSGKKYGLWYSSETYFCIQQYEIGGNFQEIILKDLPIQNSASTVKKSVANMDCFSDLRFLQKMPKILLRYITSSSGKIIKVDQFQTWMHEFHLLLPVTQGFPKVSIFNQSISRVSSRYEFKVGHPN